MINISRGEKVVLGKSVSVRQELSNTVTPPPAGPLLWQRWLLLCCLFKALLRCDSLSQATKCGRTVLVDDLDGRGVKEQSVCESAWE